MTTEQTHDQPGTRPSEVRSDALLANRPIVEATIWRLVEEAQDRYRPGAEIASEEIIAWLTSRTTHWFANTLLSGLSAPTGVEKEG